ncbi:DUF4157 domain-containing protein [Leptolyngbya sp. PCC 6406]|uniref:eCIS core domain-containing protein n=1 Tax=Leptolyngbya sp. PCC 6406 TaxID=1173264 RepID=UPI0002AC04C8|nr:DUF4157 domain-containing protein [Leptolyngbya sp. PCC 6406]
MSGHTPETASPQVTPAAPAQATLAPSPYNPVGDVFEPRPGQMLSRPLGPTVPSRGSQLWEERPWTSGFERRGSTAPRVSHARGFDIAHISIFPKAATPAPPVQRQCDGCEAEQEQEQTHDSIQAKIAIGAPNDPYEQEADRVAAQVMAMSDPAPIQRLDTETPEPDPDQIQAKAIAVTITPVQAKFLQRDALPDTEEPEEEEPLQAKLLQRDALLETEEPIQTKFLQRDAFLEDEEPLQAKRLQREAFPQDEELLQAKLLQRDSAGPEEEPVQFKATVQRSAKGGFTASHDLETRLQRSKGGGIPLSEDVRSFMEPRFGADFSQVRVHTGTEAVQMNKEVGAQAFTHGTGLYFNAGKYAPDADSGKQLLAHELTHTIQQTGSQLQRKPHKLQFKVADAPATEKAESQPSPNQKDKSSSQKAEPQSSPNQKDKPSSQKAEPQASSNQKDKPSSQKAEPQSSPNQEDKSPSSQASEETAPQPEAAPPEPAAPGATAASQPEENQPEENPGNVAAAAQNSAATAPGAAAVSGSAVGAAASASGAVTPAAEENPGFQAVVADVGTVAEAEQAHEPAEAEAEAAQAAAQSPDNEVESQAEGQQVDVMNQQPPGSFNAEAFKATLLARIAAVIPETEEAADNFGNNNELDSVRSGVSSQVATEQEQASGAIREASEAEPNTSGIEPRVETPLVPAEPGTAMTEVGAERAAPTPQPEAVVSAPLAANAQSVDQQMAEANVTEEQLANSNEPEFQSALTARDEVRTHAATAPVAYRQEEQGVIEQTQTDAQAESQQQLTAMHGDREAILGQVVNQQTDTQTQDEAERAKVANEINGIYEQTKTDVEATLDGLEDGVTSKFDVAAEKAKQAFENHVKRKMDAWKKERYGEWYDVSGYGTRAWDALTSLPPEVNEFFVEGKQLYIDQMDVALTDIANLVADTLNQAKDRIAEGRQQIHDYVTGLPESLQEFGREAAENIQAQFDDLEESVNDKQEELIDSLAQSYSEGIQAVDARITEMQAANRGLWDKAKDAVGGALNTIAELKNMLMGALAGAAGSVNKIIQDPIGFLGNLIAGVKQGFQNFSAKIGEHLQNGLLGWLTGEIAGAGIQLPDKLDLKGIFTLVMQVLGLVYNMIRQKVAKLVGEPVVGFLEKHFEMFIILKNEGIAGLWQYIQDKVGDLQETVIGGIKDFVSNSVIKAGITWILSLLNPASAFVKACMAIVNIVKFLIERGRQIADLVAAVTGSISAMAEGAMGVAATAIEGALGKSVPVVISFMASLLGLGGISQKIQSIIEKVRKPINKAIGWVISKAIAFARKLGFGKDKEKNTVNEVTDPEKKQKIRGGLTALDQEEKKYTKEGKISKEDAEKAAANVKATHPVFTSITVVDGVNTWDYDYIALAREKGGKKQEEDPTAHRGRLQVQGGGLELSWPWARPTPPNAQESIVGLNSLKSQLNKTELKLRDKAFEKAEAYINKSSKGNGVDAPVSLTFQNDNLPKKNKDARVDVEVKTGKAFVK